MNWMRNGVSSKLLGDGEISSALKLDGKGGGRYNQLETV